MAHIAQLLVDGLKAGKTNSEIAEKIDFATPKTELVGALMHLNKMRPLEYQSSDNLTFLSLLAKHIEMEFAGVRLTIGLARVAPSYTESQFVELVNATLVCN